MALYRQRGSKVWWYEFQMDGVRYRESSKSTSKTLAAKALEVRRRQVQEAFNGIVKRSTPRTFSTALDDFLSAKSRTVSTGTLEILTRCGKHLMPTFGRRMLFEITAAEIMDYKDRRRSPSISERYVNMDLSVMRAVLRRNGLWEKIRPDYAMYRVNSDVGKELQENEEQRLLEQCQKSISRGLYVAVTIALCTGMRCGEIRHLRWRQVSLGNEPLVVVGESKTETGRQRRVPLNAKVLATLSEWSREFPNRKPEDYVFPTEKYSKEPDGRLAAVYAHDPSKPIGSWRVAWKGCCKRADIELRFHDLRHTAVTRMLRAGTPLTTVAAIVGWSPSSMFLMAKRYAHILQPEMRRAVSILGENEYMRTAGNWKDKKPIPVPGRLRARYNREELYERVWQVPLLSLAKEYGVSDVALAKTCRKLGIPIPGRGYWAKKAAHRGVPPQPPLPMMGV